MTFADAPTPTSQQILSEAQRQATFFEQSPPLIAEQLID
jgi:hypothetical protein